MFALVLAVVFAVELTIMLAVSVIPPKFRDDLWLSLADSALLVAALCPALWILIVRPLRGLVAERGALFRRSLEIQEEERARLSRDLHDELGQAQTAVLLGLRSIINARTLEEAGTRAEAAHRIATSAIESTRRIARGLSPTVLRDFGIGCALERICEDFSAAGSAEILRKLEVGDLRFDPAIEISAYRVVQEAITNALKHAGAAQVRVTLSYRAGRLQIGVSDDGRGMLQSGALDSGSGLGLSGMRERVVLLGGEFEVTSDESIGTIVRAAIPAHPVRP